VKHTRTLIYLFMVRLTNRSCLSQYYQIIAIIYPWHLKLRGNITVI